MSETMIQLAASTKGWFKRLEVQLYDSADLKYKLYIF